MAKHKQILDPGELRRRWELRWRARTDLIWLCNNVLNYTLINEKVHGPIADRLQKFPLPPTEKLALEADPILPDGRLRYTPWNNPYELPGPRRQLILDPRSSAKTTLNTTAHTIQWLINYPHLAIALLFATEDKAEDTIKNEIKKHFQTNQVFRDLFPDLVPHARINDWGTAKSFTIPGRDAILQRLKRPPRKEPSVMSLSIDKAGTGYHFDVINCSDVVEVSNVVTTSNRNQVKSRVGMLPKLLVEPNGWVKIEGTFYHPADLHSDLVKNWIENHKKGLPQNWDIFIRSAFVRDTKGGPITFTPADLEFRSFKLDSAGREISFWPERFSWEELQRIKRDPIEGGYAFASQYLLDLNAADTIDRPFSAPISWTTRADFQRVPIDFTIITVDLADTQNEKSNPSVFTVTSFDRRGHAYVREIKRGKWTSDKIIDILFDLDKKYQPIKIFIENYAYVDGFKPFIKTKSQRTGQFPPFEFLKRKRNANEKVQRIVRALQPPYNNGEIHFLTPLVAGADDPRAPEELRVENAEIVNALETELRECTLFSTGSTDDILDTLADIYLSREYFGKGRGVGGGAHIQSLQAIDTLQREQYQKAYMEMVLGAQYGPDGFLVPLNEQLPSGDWD